MVLNDIADLENRVKGSYDSGELDDFLERGNRSMQGDVGKHLRHDDVAKDNQQDTFDVPVEELEEIDRVEYNGEKVDAADYSVDLDKGEITFDSSFATKINRGDVVRIYFKPVLMADLEMEYAVKSAWRKRYRSTGNDTAKASVDDADDAITSLRNRILGLNSETSAYDHSGRGRPTGGY